MRPWDSVKREMELIEAGLHADRLEERVWECAPLLVIDASDGSVAFVGHSKVDVKPHADGTADLTAEAERDGWRPSLVSAKVEMFVYEGQTRGSRNGLRCLGRDSEGFAFCWHINGAADYFAEMHPLDFDGSTLGPEGPELPG